MPSQSKICIVGDSQIGAASVALDTGLLNVPDGLHIEFWGNAGPAFRTLAWKDGAMCFDDAKATQTAEAINGNGVQRITPDSFDHLVFFGARLRTPRFFASYLEWRAARSTDPSAAAMVASAQDFLVCTRAYRLARQFVQAGTPVAFLPDSFPTDGVVDLFAGQAPYANTPAAAHATADDRAILWECLVQAAAMDGVTLLPQPEDTIAHGLVTDLAYACDNAIETEDASHKSPAFAARWLQDLWPSIAKNARAA